MLGHHGDAYRHHGYGSGRSLSEDSTRPRLLKVNGKIRAVRS